MKYVYVEEFKDKHQFRQAFDDKAAAIGFANRHYEKNPDVIKAYVIEAPEDDPELDKWVSGKIVKVICDK